MTKPRKLVKDDRVKITGPWRLDTDDNCGERHIGKFATVIKNAGGPKMSIYIRPDGFLGNGLYWQREHLRALPRKATQ